MLISSFKALFKPGRPWRGLESATEGSLQISGRTHKPLCTDAPVAKCNHGDYKNIGKCHTDIYINHGYDNFSRLADLSSRLYTRIALPVKDFSLIHAHRTDIKPPYSLRVTIRSLTQPRLSFSRWEGRSGRSEGQ
ncbi:hypothetical protein PoB_006037900 [Plakobranchus ocellatus]|uniref:Uncharacterized protein n=1 Tax=Plakobranchus ocellatus TaxID=259542 RepID=A0AAV4CPS4_9GAST|nr:hypothetical protein PoB_006037900 [Plakobranchus ocellatus]